MEADKEAKTYGFQLGNYGQISRSATIRTLTVGTFCFYRSSVPETERLIDAVTSVGNSIIDAESIWANNVTTTSTTQRKQKRAAFVG